MNIAIYARFSSDNQREESITAQLRACRDYCKKRKYSIIKEYTDEAFSARSDDRPEFQRMISDARTGMFDVIICHKIDRFSRDRYDYAHYQRILKKSRVSMEFVEQNLDGSPESIILESVLVGMAEYYSKNLAKEVQKGMRENAYKCLHTGGKPPIGYDVGPDKKYIVNESEALIVRHIFRRYSEGATYGDIMAELQEKGYRTKTGSLFGKNSIHDLLKNKKYIGIYTFGRVSGGRSNPRNNHQDSENMIEIPGGMPAIIDMATWEKAVVRLQGRQREKGQLHAKETYLLSGLVYCGTCGGAMTGGRVNGSHRSKGRWVYAYYRCGKSLQTNVICPTKRVKKDWLDDAAVEYVKSTIFNDESISRIVESVNSQAKASIISNATEAKVLEKEKKSVLKKIENLYLLAEDGQIDDSLRDRLAQHKQRKAQIDARMSEIDRQNESARLTEDQVKSVMYSWKDAKEPHELKSMLNTFIQRVTVSEDGINIALKLKIASHEVAGDDLSTNISHNEMRKLFLVPQLTSE